MRCFSSLLLCGLLAASGAAAPKPAPRAPTSRPANKPAPAGKPASAGKPAPAGPDLPSRLPAGAHVAVVNGERIPLSLYVDRLSLRFGPEVRELLIEETLLRQEAKRRGLSATPAEIDAMTERALADSVRRFGSEQRLADELARTRGWSVADYRAAIRTQAEAQVLREKLAAALVPASQVTETEVRQAYEERRENFRQPESVRISHILVRRPEGDAAGEAAARKKAESLLETIRRDPAAFERTAREASDDRATAERGGAIPMDIYRGAHPFGAAFDAAVFSAPTGLVGEVVASPLGFHIIRVDSKKEGGELPLEAVREQIRAALLAERRRQALEALSVRLRAQARVETGKF